MKTDDVIAQVLDAEREALEAIARSEDEARALVAAGREDVRRIAARADQRVTAVRTRLTEQAAARIAALEAEIARLRTAGGAPPAERPRLDAALRRLAAELVAGGEG
jgi:vacuolar-type H+-ATPase subunit H